MIWGSSPIYYKLRWPNLPRVQIWPLIGTNGIRLQIWPQNKTCLWRLLSLARSPPNPLSTGGQLDYRIPPTWIFAWWQMHLRKRDIGSILKFKKDLMEQRVPSHPRGCLWTGIVSGARRKLALPDQTKYRQQKGWCTKRRYEKHI